MIWWTKHNSFLLHTAKCCIKGELIHRLKRRIVRSCIIHCPLILLSSWNTRLKNKEVQPFCNTARILKWYFVYKILNLEQIYKKFIEIPHRTSRIKSCKGPSQWQRQKERALNQVPPETGRAFKRHKDVKVCFIRVSWSSGPTPNLEYWAEISSLSSKQQSYMGHYSPQGIGTIYLKTLLSVFSAI